MPHATAACASTFSTSTSAQVSVEAISGGVAVTASLIATVIVACGTGGGNITRGLACLSGVEPG